MNTKRFILMVCCVCALPSCASNQAQQTITRSPGATPAPIESAPAEPAPEVSAPQAAQQSGQGNLTGQIHASGWKAIEYSSAVPVGQVILMGLMLVLSHWREMARIRQNGKHAS